MPLFPSLSRRLPLRHGSLLKLRDFVPARRQRMEDACRARAQAAYLGGETALCRVLGRFKLYVDTGDVGLSSHLMLDGYWELWVTEFLAERMRRGMVAVDVGANLGYFSMIMAELVGDAGAVHAFEPNPAIAQRLVSSAHVNGFAARIRIHRHALGAAEGNAFRLQVPEGYPGGAFLVEAQPHEDGAVSVRRLDAFPELLDADIIKIDAEGSEYAIWQGMAGLLARGRPLVILLEFVRDRYPDPSGFLREIQAAGFAINHVGPDSPLGPIRPEEVLTWRADQDGMLVLIR